MVDLEKLQELYDAAGSCDEIDEAIADELPAIIAELTALRAKVAAGKRLREAIGGHQLAIVSGLNAQAAGMHIAMTISEYDAAVGVE